MLFGISFSELIHQKICSIWFVHAINNKDDIALSNGANGNMFYTLYILFLKRHK